MQRQENTWWRETVLVVTKPEEFQKGLLETYHNSEMAGHPGMNQTYQQVACNYWWPELQKFVQSYIRGCGNCQQSKVNMHPNCPALNPILLPESPKPFKVISVDLITKLPKLKGSDMILMIMDQGSTKAVILVPCNKIMGMEQLAYLYKEQAFPYIGVPSKLISDWDI